MCRLLICSAVLSICASAPAQLTFPPAQNRPAPGTPTAPPRAYPPVIAPAPAPATVPGIVSPAPAQIIPGLNAPAPVPTTAPVATTAPAPGLAPIPTALPDAAQSARIADLVRAFGDSLVFVEGVDGQGSGFLCSLYGKRSLLTNQHVIAGNPNARFTTLTQTVVKTGAAKAAAGHDLISYEAPESTSSLRATADVMQTAAVGDEVVVLGNTEGARVIKPLPGKLIAIGPDLIEISSEFLPGNSGSPIVHLKSGEVIGVATYAIIRKVNSLTGGNEPSVRRFGYRLDSVKAWQPVNWPLYQSEAAAVKKMTEFTGSVIRLLMDVRGGQFVPSRHHEMRLKPAVSQLETLFTRRNMNPIDRQKLVHNFLGELRNVVQRDVQDLRARLRYDYFQRELAEEGKLRTEIYEGLGAAMRRMQ